ncbi:uncharacterized protein PG986_010230 [Apiospora aurea]|uniref:F-box domain-containing protein n=1 Tax=Apiospora aurea TaxID=335848 RepID=A0ABR1QA00_9PEZI
MGLQQMPLEVLCLIFCEKIRAATLRILYQSITLGTDDHSCLTNTSDGFSHIFLAAYDAEEFVLARKHGYLQYTNSLSIKAPFYKVDNGHEHCFHTCEEAQSIEDQIAGNLLPVFNACKEGILQSFSWETGTCPPQSILGPTGYHPTNQRNITSLRLVTTGDCAWTLSSNPMHPKVPPPPALSSFSKLREFSWAGLSSTDFNSLRALLLRVGPQLTKLELNLEWYCHQFFQERERVPMPPFSETVLRLHRPEPLVFLALTSLSLSNICLDAHNLAIVKSIPFSNLEHLKLHFCPGTDRILRYLAASRSIGLRTFAFEIGYYYITHHDEEAEMAAITEFLESFQGLEELYINILDTPAPPTKEIWQSLGRHRKTLRRFAYHQQEVGHPARGVEELKSCITDVLDLGFSEITDLDIFSLGHPFRHLDLRGIGLGCSPKWLTPILSPFRYKTSLRLLHMRRSGQDLNQDEDLLNTPGFAMIHSEIRRCP